MAQFKVTNTNNSGTGSLRKAVTNANNKPGADNIVFDSSLNNQTILLTSGEIAVTDDLTIEGLGQDSLTIDGNGNSRIFRLSSTYVKPNSLTVTDLTLTNGFATPTLAMPDAARGGAIITEHQASLTVENVNFIGNVADDGGGAIYSAYEGNLTVKSNQFINNDATAGNDERGAGAIAFFGPGQLTVTDSDFIGNKGINGGAINNLAGRVTIENSNFINNDVLDATFATGEPNDFLRGYGGAIFSDRVSPATDPNGGVFQIIDSTFEGNQGRSAGGAVYIYTGGNDSVEVNSSVFRNNQAVGLPNGENGNSGAIELQSDEVNQGFLIVNSEFSNNQAVDRGGAIRTRNAPTTIINSTFSENETTIEETPSFIGGVGGALELGGAVDVDIVNSTFDNNHATWVGGAIGGNANIEVNNSLFYDNTAANGTNNWLVQQHTVKEFSGSNNLQYPLIGNDNLVSPNTIIGDPLLEPLKDNGGTSYTRGLKPSSPAINAGNNSLTGLDIFDVDNDGDTSEKIPYDQRGVGFNRTINNQVDIGAFEYNPFQVTNTKNKGAGSLRQAINNANNTPGLDTITFSSNLIGKTINLTSGKIKITDDVYIDGLGNSNLTIQQQTTGDRIFLINNSNRDLDVTIEGLTITGGKTIGNGGAIYSQENLTLENVTITGNTGAKGGGVASRFGTLEIINSIISGNSATNRGGGIFANLDTVNISYSTISGNSSINGGGGINSSDNTLNIVNSTISGNNGHKGGGIFARNDSVNILNSTIYNNTVNTSGTAIYGNANTNITLGNSIFYGSAGNNDLLAFNVTNNGYNAIGSYNSSLNGTFVNHDLVAINPVLGVLQDNGGNTLTHAILTDSPLINSGNNTLANNANLIYDQRGLGSDRIFNATVDIGAFESIF